MKNSYKKNIVLLKAGFVFVVLLLTTCSCSVFAAGNDTSQITQTYSFQKPQVQHVTINNQVYDQVILTNAEGAGEAGEPDLPAYGVTLLLPQGSTITDITIQPSARVSLGSGYFVEPVEQPVKLSEEGSVPVAPVVNERLYASDDVFPSTLFTKVGTYSFRGYDLLVLLLYPVQYIPHSRTLFYFTDMTVTVNTEKTGVISPLFRNLEKDQIELSNKVDNPSLLSSYTDKTHTLSASDSLDLLILTTKELESGFEPLKAAHDAQGIRTEIKTLNDISLLPNQVTADDVREFIRTEYMNTGIEYVLIGGDDDVVPAKQLWVQAQSDADNMPSDLYYSCLDGTYNYDGDNKWGEPTDGERGKDVDLIAEVYAGRACVGDMSEVNNFVQKTLTYMNSGGYPDGKALFVGELLWAPPDYQTYTYGDDYMDELINGSTAHGYSTKGFPSSKYTIEKLYDQLWGYPPGWPTSAIIEKINGGVRFINHLGHANEVYDMRMVTDDVEALNNTMLPFIYSQGCYAGAFDMGDCIAESFTVKTTHAAFAGVWNARYGWGTAGSTNGPSQRYHREFWDAVFKENITSIGKANQDSREDCLSKINGQCMRWCYYQVNLFGDPTLTFFPPQNTVPSKPATPSGDSIGHTGTNYTFTSSATDPDGDKLYFKWSFGDGTFSSWMGPYNSDDQVSASHNWSKRGKYEVKVKVRDEHRAESDWSDPAPIRMPVDPDFPLLRIILHFLENYFPQLYALLTQQW